ncbi:MAG: tetratricopeptide repeat protein, partial [Clostridia bacterium]|nr:tetratricopeptide repeat protein [Clostridia bacterium]
GSLEKALQDAFGRLSLQEKNSSPEHLYCIALAYLGGIDVEVDHERALDLMTRASNGGHLDATKKLVSMYTNGEGVARSYQKAIAIQVDFVKHLEKMYEAFEAIRKVPTYAEELYTLSTLYERSHSQTLQKETLVKLKDVCDQYNQSWKDVYKMAAILGLGELANEQGNYQEARQYFLESIFECEKGMKQGLTGEALFYARSCLMMGSLGQKYNDLEIAKEYYKRAISIADEYREKLDFERTYLVAYLQLGNVETSLGNLSEAEALFQKAEACIATLQKEGNDVEAGALGLLQRRKELQIEQEYQKELQGIWQDYHRNMSSNPEQDAKEFQTMQKRIEDLNARKKEAVSHDDEIEKQKEQLQALEEEVSTTEIEDQRKLAVGKMSLGITYIGNQQYAEAEEPLTTAVNFYEKYISTHPDADAEIYLVGSMNALSQVYEKTGRLQEAKICDEKVLNLCESTVAKRGNVKDYELLLAAYVNNGAKEKENQQIDKAYALYQKAVETGKTLTQMDSGRKPKELLASAYYSLSYVKGAKPEPLPLAHAFKIYTDLKEQYPDDRKILTELNRVQGSFMLGGVSIAQIESYVKQAEKEDKGKKLSFKDRFFGKK